MKKSLPLFFSLALNFAFAQKENNNWVFGNNAWLDFNTGSPVPVAGSQMMTFEGCSSISDASGALMFYTDGVTVWDKMHNVMPNGNFLFGNFSSTQSGLIVPQPGQPDIYYLFTSDDTNSPNGVNYSVVDMSLNGGLGDVTLKNVLLHAPAAEQLSACRNSNGTDYWILTHHKPGNEYYVYPLTSAGVGTPVITAVGSMFGTTSIGQMKYSCVNNKVANVFYTFSVDLLDFDPSTGVLSNSINISNFSGTPYGLEFSPNGNFLYVSTWDQMTLTQFDITSGNAATINASSFQIAGSINNLGSIQTGPDHKLYVAHLSSAAIGTINDPDLQGAACNYVDQAINLNGAQSQYGLPNFPQCAYPSTFVPVALFTAPNHICPGTCTSFNNLSQNATSYLWSFQGASPSTSTDVNPQNICYNTPGTYAVSLIASNSQNSDTITLNNYITVYPYPPPQGITQIGDTLFANAGAVSYQWYENGIPIPFATNYFYVALESGDYNVVATDANGCEVEAVIFDVIAGIHSVTDQAQQVVISPNPVSGYLTIDQQSLPAINKAISIHNVLGEIVFRKDEIQITPVDCSTFFPGVYFLEVTSGSQTLRAKFIKQ